MYAAVPALLLSAALAGCSDDSTDDTAAPAAPTSAAGPSSAAPSSAAPSAKTSSKTSAKPSAAGGCPVTAAVLEKAYKANAEVAGALVLGKGLTNVSCYQGWATAQTQPTDVDQAVVLFQYDAAKKSWAALIGGTDGVCRDTVPEDVATHLAGCQN
ncbi:hypothetical protein GCM10010170_089400 [Dactylosporangium salmoneum]|uniref:Lipoprotein n=2 Tax=Dactylosporangium salmoneum TaxID=53361 RepID=A0ABP5UKX8_9ACTN